MLSTAGNHSVRYSARENHAPRLWQMLQTVYAIWRERRVLDSLDDTLLRDIGVSRHDAKREARRQPWDAPHRFMY